MISARSTPSSVAPLRIRPGVEPEAPVVELSSRPRDLAEYYRLRGKLYSRVLGLSAFPSEADDHDAHSLIAIARHRGRIVGGARLTLKSPGSLRALPMESASFRLRDQLPEYRPDEEVHGEISRLAILPEWGRETLDSLVGLLLGHARQQEASFLVAAAPKIQARRYRSLQSKLGFRMTVRDDLAPNAGASTWGLDLPVVVFENEEATSRARRPSRPRPA